MVAKSCSRSHGQPRSLSRSRAMMASSRSMLSDMAPNLGSALRPRQRLLRGQVVLDEGADDLVHVAVALEPHLLGTAAVDVLRPTRDDLLDHRVGLPADAAHGLLAAGAAQ